MIWLYRLAFLPAFILAMPYYAARMLRRGGYAKDFSHRFGCQKDLPPPAAGKKRIWIQAVSVGEVGAVSTLLKILHASGRYEVVLTTTTSTAYKIVREKYSGLCYYVGVFPFDFYFCSRRAWRRIKPDAIVLMEGELWPEHMHSAHVFKKPLFLINARMSDRSFSRYSKIKALARRMFSKFTAIACGGEFDAKRFLALGANPEKLSVTGNIKFDSRPDKILTQEEKTALKLEMGFPENALVLLGSSTWEGEEKMLADFALNLSRENPGLNLRLLIVPRHAERRAAVRETLAASGAGFHFRSESKKSPREVLVYVADTTGELATLTQAADFAFIGKSMPPNVGGQSPLDCAAAAVAMVYGPNMTNFRQMCKSLEECEAAVKTQNPQEALSSLRKIAEDSALRAKLSKNAKTWHSANLGASQRSFDIIDSALRQLENPEK